MMYRGLLKNYACTKIFRKILQQFLLDHKNETVNMSYASKLDTIYYLLFMINHFNSQLKSISKREKQICVYLLISCFQITQYLFCAILANNHFSYVQVRTSNDRINLVDSWLSHTQYSSSKQGNCARSPNRKMIHFGT